MKCGIWHWWQTVPFSLQQPQESTKHEQGMGAQSTLVKGILSFRSHTSFFFSFWRSFAYQGQLSGSQLKILKEGRKHHRQPTLVAGPGTQKLRSLTQSRTSQVLSRSPVTLLHHRGLEAGLLISPAHDTQAHQFRKETACKRKLVGNSDP